MNNIYHCKYRACCSEYNSYETICFNDFGSNLSAIVCEHYKTFEKERIQENSELVKLAIKDLE